MLQGDKQQQRPCLGEIALNDSNKDSAVKIKPSSKAPTRKSQRIQNKVKIDYRPVPKAVKLAAQLESGHQLIDLESVASTTHVH
jgi:hypothetical protein